MSEAETSLIGMNIQIDIFSYMNFRKQTNIKNKKQNDTLSQSTVFL